MRLSACEPACARRPFPLVHGAHSRVNSGATKMGLNTAFTQQTKALDVDQHMVEYVEKEMKKRKGIADDVQPTAKDYFADLYTVPEHLRVRCCGPWASAACTVPLMGLGLGRC